MEEIIRKEIRGVNTKIIAWILTPLISFAIGAGWGYANIINALKDNQKQTAVTNVTLDILKADIKALQIHQQDQDIRLTRIEEQIKDKVFITDAPPSFRVPNQR